MDQPSCVLNKSKSSVPKIGGLGHLTISKWKKKTVTILKEMILICLQFICFTISIKKMILVKGRIPKKHYFQTVLIDHV